MKEHFSFNCLLISNKFVTNSAMKYPIVNPFQFGDPVEGDYYLPRPGLVNTVRQFLENRIHVVLIGPRRFGKTSFILNLLKGLKKDGFTCLFVDIFNITSHRDFLQQMLRALGLKNNWLKDLVAVITKIRPKISAGIDPSINCPSFNFSLDCSSEGDIKEAIQDIYSTSLEKRHYR